MRTPLRLGPGPVFVYEAIAATRRWSFFAMRSIFVLALLAGLAVVWMVVDAASIHALAALGEYFYYAIATVQVTMVLLVAPVATADAICVDRARGNLTHMLVTDLSSAEIVLGKLAARFVAVLALVGAAVPVLALAGLLGGIVFEAIVELTVITLALAVLGCSLALALSVGSRKTHEVLMAVYAIEAVWIMGPVVWSLLAAVGGYAQAPSWCWQINPYAHVLDPYLGSRTMQLAYFAVIVGATLAVSASLVGWAILRIRAVERKQDGVRAARRPSRWARGWQWLMARRRQPSLDHDPVLWREWRKGRPSRLARLVWGFYLALALAGTVWAIVAAGDRRNGLEVMAFTNGFQATLALLMASVTAPTVLAEERIRGSLDVLLASPLATEQIVLAKWRGAFRVVPALALLPAIGWLWTAFAAPDAQLQGRSMPNTLYDPPTMVDRTLIVVFPVAFFLAQGLVVTGLGLVLATWFRRVGRAVALSVAGLAAVAFGWPIVVETEFLSEILDAVGVVDPNLLETPEVLALILSACPLGAQISPIICATEPTVQARYAGYLMLCVALLATLALALLLLGLVLATFDRCVGRVPVRPRRPPQPPAQAVRMGKPRFLAGRQRSSPLAVEP